MPLSDYKIVSSNGANEHIYSNGKNHIGITSEIVQNGKKLERHWKATHLETKKELGMGRSRGIALGTGVEALEGSVKKAYNDDPTREEMESHLKESGKGFDDPNEEEANEFDRQEAIHYFATLYHGGQSSNLYSALSTSKFRPGPLWNGPEKDSDSEMKFQSLVSKFGGKDNVKKALPEQSQPKPSEPHELMEQQLGHRGALKYLKANYDTSNELGIHNGMEVHTALSRVSTKTGKHPKDLLNDMMTTHPDIIGRFRDFGFDTMKSEAAVEKSEKHPLAKLGFKLTPGSDKNGKWHGTMEPEEYDVGKDHFTPRFRDVFHSGETSGSEGKFHYVTSSIHGKMRPYKAQHSFDTTVGNIFGSGKTAEEAISNFSENLKNKKYNIAKSEASMSDVKEYVKKAILKKAMAWLLKATGTTSVVADSGVDKAASELYKSASPEHIDFDAEIKKSEPSALDKWEPEPWVATSLKKAIDYSKHDGGAARKFDEVMHGKNMMTPHREKVVYSPDGNHIAEISSGVGLSGEKRYGVSVLEAKPDGDTHKWVHSREKSTSAGSWDEVWSHIDSLGSAKKGFPQGEGTENDKK